MLQIDEKLRDTVLNCMVSAIYPNASYIAVNQIVTQLAKLEPVKKRKKKSTNV